MIVSSHQPHYFPWIGYFDKMAKSDLFLINDVANLEKKSPMVRDLFIGQNKKTNYLTLSVEKSVGNTENKDIRLLDPKRKLTDHKNWLLENYRKALFFDEIWPYVEKILSRDYIFLIELQVETIKFIRFAFDIRTPMLLHSELNYTIVQDVNLNLINKLKAVKATTYLSGKGAKKYMINSLYENQGIAVIYQDFVYPKYKQINADRFIENLSSLDLLFNEGIFESRKIFKKNILKEMEKE